MRQHKIHIRTCIACRTTGDKKGLLRIVRTPSGEIVVDNTGKLPGRGAYICRSVECLSQAIRQKRFPKALRTELPEEIIKKIEEALKQGSEDM